MGGNSGMSDLEIASLVVEALPGQDFSLDHNPKQYDILKMYIVNFTPDERKHFFMKIALRPIEQIVFSLQNRYRKRIISRREYNSVLSIADEIKGCISSISMRKPDTGLEPREYVREYVLNLYGCISKHVKKLEETMKNQLNVHHHGFLTNIR